MMHLAAWQLSRIATAVRTSAWTHVFSQRFTDVEAHTVPQLMHPIHCAHVDRRFSGPSPSEVSAPDAEYGGCR